MSNNGEQILTRQNIDSNIELLAAQKEIYSTAKIFFIVQCLIVGPLAVLVSILTATFSGLADKLGWIFALYTITALITELVLDEIISSLKKKASAIQELFDHNVLGLEWNFTLISRKPDYADINKYYKKYQKRGVMSLLSNWYSLDIRVLTTNIATIISQRTNCTYDFSLRKIYSTALMIISISVFIILFIISASTGITTQSFIVEILAPSMPVFILAWKQISSNREAVQNLGELKSLIEAVITNSEITSIIDEKTIRQIQDKIYYNRNLSPLLPDWIFHKLRSSLEEGMNFSVSEQIRELSQR